SIKQSDLKGHSLGVFIWDHHYEICKPGIVNRYYVYLLPPNKVPTPFDEGKVTEVVG
ncbi:9047_t:CDS:1, partial [Paraglomus occultum]